MEVNEIPDPEAPDLGTPTGDTGAYQDEQTEAPQPGTPEYLGHMAQRGGATPEEVAMIIKAAQGTEEQNDDTTDINADTDGDGGGADPDESLAAGSTEGLDLPALQQEVTDNGGKLTDESLDKLEAMGFKRADIEAYVDSQYKLAKDEGTRIAAEVYSEVGGKERYLSMIEWAGDNMPLKDVKSINADLKSGDLSKIKDAMGRLNDRYTTKNGNPPRKIQRGTKRANTGPTDVFRSQAELSAAINDPRYSKDPAYQRDVALKLKRSPAFRMG